MTTTAGVVGLGTSAFAGQVSAADEEPKRTLTIEATGSSADYRFSVDGKVVRSQAMGATIGGDDVSGNSVDGHVAGSGRDSYTLSGELTSFDVDGDIRMYLNGEPLSDTVTIEDDPEGEATHYELRVDGEVLKSTAMAATIDENDEISPRDHPDEVEPLTSAEPLAGETYALGQVNNGTDSYVISGDITGFHADGRVDLYVNEGKVDYPAQFVRTTLTFESTNGDHATYEFSTSGDISKSRAMGASISDSDTAGDGGASGAVGGNGRDSYAFTGEITDFAGDDNLRVFLSREEVDKSTLAAEPQFENTVTIEGNGGETEYRFSVEGSLEENYGLGPEDDLDGETADGAVTSGQDSYTFSGDISTFSTRGNGSFTTYLNGNEVDPETLGHVRTGPDPDTLPNEVTVRALTDARTEYSFGVSGTLATGDRSNTYSGDNAAYEYARGWVSGGGLDSYMFSGEVTTVTDFENSQVNVDREDQTISIEDFDSDGVTEYEIVVSGELNTTSSSSEGNVSGRTATGAIADGTDVYEFTGDVRKIILEGVIMVESATSYPRVVDNPYPDSTVGELASEFALAPGGSRAAFTTNAIGDGDDLYIARGVASDGELPSEIQLVSEGIIAGVADLDWQDENTVTFWRDGFECEQTMVEPNVISKPIAVSEKPYPESDDGGEN
ncbi:hypothetical protein [Halococcus sp. IIIV-5B]|uniref:hypothetical protein n=1 Tax=Halococcus sp. IIIV-5B TaxID=2321230 RepID=UPI0011C3C45A|nr:hypothetical protein [Halococcus sp. IIIV-5B]